MSTALTLLGPLKGLLNRTLKDKITEAWQLLRQGGGVGVGLTGQRERGVGRETPSSQGRKGDVWLYLLCSAAAGHQDRGGLGHNTLPLWPTFLSIPDFCNSRRR